MFPIEFINDDGEVQPFDLFNETTYRPTATYQAASGQTWR
jgi:hypothetical protein